MAIGSNELGVVSFFRDLENGYGLDGLQLDTKSHRTAFTLADQRGLPIDIGYSPDSGEVEDGEDPGVFVLTSVALGARTIEHIVMLRQADSDAPGFMTEMDATEFARSRHEIPIDIISPHEDESGELEQPMLGIQVAKTVDYSIVLDADRGEKFKELSRSVPLVETRNYGLELRAKRLGLGVVRIGA